VIVLGVDPGTAATGYGIISREGGRLRAIDYGCVETSAALPLPERLLRIHDAIDDLVERHGPDLVGVERIFFSRNAQTAFAVGQARGVVLLAAARRGIEIRDATPNEVKSAIAGYGAADKEQVQRMVALVLGLAEPPTPDDAADALAIAVCVANRERASDTLRSGALDRAATAPHEARRTPYEAAVRDALARERPRGRPRPPAGSARRG
jgi:crossover junction endodeoxyribonuclease RuvC